MISLRLISVLPLLGITIFLTINPMYQFRRPGTITHAAPAANTVYAPAASTLYAPTVYAPAVSTVYAPPASTLYAPSYTAPTVYAPATRPRIQPSTAYRTQQFSNFPQQASHPAFSTMPYRRSYTGLPQQTSQTPFPTRRPYQGSYGGSYTSPPQQTSQTSGSYTTPPRYSGSRYRTPSVLTNLSDSELAAQQTHLATKGLQHSRIQTGLGAIGAIGGIGGALGGGLGAYFAYKALQTPSDEQGNQQSDNN